MSSPMPLSPLSPAPIGRPVQTGDGPAIEWHLRRNCSSTPRACLLMFAGIWGLTMAIAAGFWAMGYPVVGLFGMIEMAVLGIALFVYARHALDQDKLTLDARHLRVEQQRGSKVTQARVEAWCVRVSSSQPSNGLVVLSAPGVEFTVGDQVRASVRAQVMRELRQALRQRGSIGIDSDGEMCGPTSCVRS